MITKQSIDNSLDQGIASYVDYLNNLRLTDLMNKLETILTSETEELSSLATKTANALSNLDRTKLEINNLMDINRGGEKGLHGFIAEFAEVGIRNARDAYQGLQEKVVLLNNNGPTDIRFGNKDMQLKFYNDILDEIKKASDYEKRMSMMFPKDHVEVIDKIMNGAKNVKVNGKILSSSKITNIRETIEAESARRGEPYSKWIKASVLKYDQVQKETIDQTLSDEVNDVNRKNIREQREIKKEANNERAAAQQATAPSLGEASKVAGIGGAVQGGLNLGLFIFQKHKNGKELWEFQAEDWKECGISTSKAAMKGGISGYSIYGLTNVCNLAAPSAGALTSGFFGLSNAIVKYRKGAVNTDEFIDLVTLNAVDATGAAVGAAVGQMAIPIPIVGALIGSIVTTTALSIGKGILNKNETKIINLYQEKINRYIDNLDRKYQVKLTELLEKYHELGELQQYSFNFQLNVQLRFASSVFLAQSVGVKKRDILKSEEEIDDYFCNKQ